MRQLSFNDQLAPRSRSSRGRKRGKTRRGQRLERWRRRAPKLAAAGLCVGVIVSAAVFGELDRLERIGDSINGTIASAAAGLGLTVQNVYSRGHKDTPRSEILAALDVKRGDPIVGFDPDEAKARLEAIGWIKSATVQRRLPDTIDIRIVERRPFALWQHGGHMVLVDREGAVIGDDALERFGHLPLVVGEGAPREAPALLDTLASEPALLHRMEAAIWVGERRWDLRFDSGLTAQLPEQDIADGWRRLVDLIYSRQLLESSVTVVDLRLADRVVLRPTHGSTQAALNAGSET